MRGTIIALVLTVLSTAPLFGQKAPGEQGSLNVRVLGHLPLGRSFSGTDLEIEHELSRPYVYLSRMLVHGTDIVSIKDPSRPVLLYSWRIPNPELHQGNGGMDNKYLKINGRYYDVQSLQFGTNGPDADLGAHVMDVTGLPDVARIKDLGFIKAPDAPGGFHEMFSYKHSDGRSLLFTTTTGPYANIYDMAKFVAGDPQQGLVGRVPAPPSSSGGPSFYHDFFVGFNPVSQQDLFYGATQGSPGTGDYVFDVTQTDTPKLLTSVTGVAGITTSHTFVPTPDHRYAINVPQYQTAPFRIFDLKPGFEGTVKTISRPIGAWLADPKNQAHNAEVRWPYVFLSAYEDGLQVVNMMDPTNPYTVGYYDTFEGPHDRGWGGFQDPDGGRGGANGAFGVDIRNADGLIVIEDFRTGFWTLKMDGFDGWNGHQWGMPNVSSEQDWDNGPDGVRKQRVS